MSASGDSKVPPPPPPSQGEQGYQGQQAQQGQPGQQGQYGQQGQPQQAYFPPPPPGPPPSHAQHPDETPIPEYNIPPYNPSGPGGLSGASGPHHPAPPSETPTGLYDPPSPTGETPGKSSWSHRFAEWGNKAAAPINALTNKFGAESFLPTTMDKECEKAGRILKSFCKEGVYSDSTESGEPVPPQPETKDSSGKPRSKPKVLLTIPPKVIARAQGLLIFTTVRAGFQVTGATGSGILIARLPDGSWSPPSGVHVHSLGAGFVAGLDLYDCVVVINSREALDAFYRTRVSLGSDLSVAAGPWGAGGMIDWGLPKSGERRQSSEDRSSGEGRHHGRKPGKEEVGSGKPASHPADFPPNNNSNNNNNYYSGPAPAATNQAQPQGPGGPGAAQAPNMSVPGSGHKQERKPSPFRDAIRRPVYSYVKSRGLYAGWQIDGTVITERKDANATFYGDRVSAEHILRGEVRGHSGKEAWSTAAHGLFDILRRAEGQGQGQGQGQGHSHGQGSGQYQGQGQGPYQGQGQGQGPGLNPGASPVPPGAAGPNATSSGPYFSPPPQNDTSSAVPPPPPSGPSGGVSGVTAGVNQMHLGGNAPPPGPAAGSKAAEAAQESQAGGSSAPPPPTYQETHPQDDLPPAYAEDGQHRPGVGDSKTG